MSFKVGLVTFFVLLSNSMTAWSQATLSDVVTKWAQQNPSKITQKPIWELNGNWEIQPQLKYPQDQDFNIFLNELFLSPQKSPLDIQNLGGWNGSGGGGGFATLKNDVSVESFLKGFQGVDFTSEALYEPVIDFKMTDLVDLAFPADWPQDKDPMVFIQERIQERVGKVFPPVASYIIENLKANVKAPVFDTDLNINALRDIGSAVSNNMFVGKVYLQWIYRIDMHIPNQKKTEVHFIRLKHLDQHLRKILTPEEYKKQLATLYLHETLYALFALDGLEDSMNVRTLVDFLLMPQDMYEKLIVNKNMDASITNLLLRGSSVLLSRTLSIYEDFLKQKKQTQSSLLHSFISLLKKYEQVELILNDAVTKGQLGQYVSYEAANPYFPSHVYDEFFYMITYMILATPAERNGISMLPTPEEAFLLLSIDNYVRSPWENYFGFLVEGKNMYPEVFKSICNYIDERHQEWEKSAAIDRNVNAIGVREWMSDRALSYCRKNP